MRKTRLLGPTPSPAHALAVRGNPVMAVSLHEIDARAADDPVDRPVPCIDHVEAGAAAQVVDTSAAAQRVVANAATETVSPRAAEQIVVAAAAAQSVVACEPEETVAPRTAADHVSSGRPGQRGRA